MPTQPATRQDIAELLHDFGHVHAQQFKRIDQRFDHVDKEMHSIKVATADQFGDVAERLERVESKVDRLLTDTHYEQLERRVARLEHLLPNRPPVVQV
jgi:tetrahydromethanopterin S-methyltransferase subunit G